MRRTYLGIGVALGILIVSGTGDVEKKGARTAAEITTVAQAVTPPAPSEQQPKSDQDKAIKRPVRRPSRHHRPNKFDTEDTPDTQDAGETALACVSVPR